MAVGLRGKNALEARHEAAAVGAGQMKIRGDGARGCDKVVVEQIECFAQFPGAAAEGVEERTILQLGEARAEIAEEGESGADGGRGFRGEGGADFGEEHLGGGAGFVREIVTVAEQDEVVPDERCATGAKLGHHSRSAVR